MESEKDVTGDSNEYQPGFYGILNAQGQFWTLRTFDNKRAAMDHLSKWAEALKAPSMTTTHKIVPVRIRLEVIEDPHP